MARKDRAVGGLVERRRRQAQRFPLNTIEATVSDTPRTGAPGSPDLLTCLRAARAIGKAWGTVILAIGLLIVLTNVPLKPIPWMELMWVAIAALTVGIGASSIYSHIGARTVLTWERDARTRAWELEDLQAFLDRKNETDTADMEIDSLAYVLLERHYQGLSTTREGCEADSVCTQKEWNKINLAFKMIGWKHGHTLSPRGHTLKASFEAWKQLTVTNRGGIMAKRNGRWRSVDVATTPPTRSSTRNSNR